MKADAMRPLRRTSARTSAATTARTSTRTTARQPALAAALLATLLAALPAVPAQALTLVSTAAGGQSATAIVRDGALPTIAADIGFSRFGTVSFVFEVGAAEAGGLAGFNAVVGHAIGAGLPGLELALDRGSFARVGSVTPAFSAVASIGGDLRRQRIAFTPAETFGVDLGDPFAAAGAQDWLIGLDGLRAGDRFALAVSAVPEPAAWALWLAGVGVVVGAQRRGRRRA